MSRLRFSLAQSMAIVLFIGVGLAALHSASVLWSSTVFTLTVAVLSAAILGAMARRGRARMTWAGFALFGWVYLGTVFGPWAAGNGVTAPPYVTRWGLDYWDSKLWSVHRVETASSGEVLFSRFTPVLPPPLVAATSGPAPVSPTAVPRVLVLTPDAFQFRRIGHCLAAILFGLVGAVLGRLIAAAEDRPNH
jgi:hypothetical protein